MDFSKVIASKKASKTVKAYEVLGLVPVETLGLKAVGANRTAILFKDDDQLCYGTTQLSSNLDAKRVEILKSFVMDQKPEDGKLIDDETGEVATFVRCFVNIKVNEKETATPPWQGDDGVQSL